MRASTLGSIRQKTGSIRTEQRSKKTLLLPRRFTGEARGCRLAPSRVQLLTSCLACTESADRELAFSFDRAAGDPAVAGTTAASWRACRARFRCWPADGALRRADPEGAGLLARLPVGRAPADVRAARSACGLPGDAFDAAALPGGGDGAAAGDSGRTALRFASSFTALCACQRRDPGPLGDRLHRPWF